MVMILIARSKRIRGDRPYTVAFLRRTGSKVLSLRPNKEFSIVTLLRAYSVWGWNRRFPQPLLGTCPVDARRTGMTYRRTHSYNCVIFQYQRFFIRSVYNNRARAAFLSNSCASGPMFVSHRISRILFTRCRNRSPFPLMGRSTCRGSVNAGCDARYRQVFDTVDLLHLCLSAAQFPRLCIRTCRCRPDS